LYIYTSNIVNLDGVGNESITLEREKNPKFVLAKKNKQNQTQNKQKTSKQNVKISMLNKLFFIY